MPTHLQGSHMPFQATWKLYRARKPCFQVYNLSNFSLAKGKLVSRRVGEGSSTLPRSDSVEMKCQCAHREERGFAPCPHSHTVPESHCWSLQQNVHSLDISVEKLSALWRAELFPTQLFLRFPLKSCRPTNAKTLRQKTVRIVTSASFLTEWIRAPTMTFSPVGR